MLEQNRSALPHQLNNPLRPCHLPTPVPENWQGEKLLKANEIEGTLAFVSYIDTKPAVSFLVIEFRNITDADGTCLCPAAEKVLKKLRAACPNLYVERNLQGDGWNVVTGLEDRDRAVLKDHTLYLTDEKSDTAPRIETHYGTPYYFIPSGFKLFDSQKVEWYPSSNFEWLCEDEKITTIVDFLNTLYRNIPVSSEPLYSYLWFSHGDKDSKTTHWFNLRSPEEVTAAAKFALKKNDAGWNVFVGVNLSTGKGDAHHRLKATQVTMQIALLCDIDCAYGNHKQKGEYVPDTDTALAILPESPTLFIDSGGGAHAYYLFTNPLCFNSDDARASAVKRNKAFLKVIRHKAPHFIGIDDVGDLSRVLRLPGTYNHKSGAMCRVVIGSGKTYTPDELDNIIRADSAPLADSAPPADSAPRENDSEWDQYRIRAMLRCLRDVKLPYKEWIDVGMVLKNEGFSVQDWIFVSSGDERFKPGECEQKWDTFNRGGVNLGTLAQIAQDFGYDPKQCWLDFKPTPYYIKPETVEKILRLEGSDLDNARAVYLAFGHLIRYVTDEDRFALYAEGVWRFCDNDTPLVPYVRAIAEKLPDPKFKLRKAKAVKDALFYLKGFPELHVRRADFDKKPYRLTVKNGVINLETGVLSRHQPELLLTKKIQIEYKPDATNEVFDKFMEQILPSALSRAAVLRFFGYALAGDPCEEKALFIYGSGGNGKGTLFRMLAPIFGEYGVNLRINALLQRKFDSDDGQSATPETNKLEGARLAVAEEIPEGRKLDAAKFKLLTSTDPQPARRLHHEAHEFSPTAVLVLCGNHLPRLNDARDVGLLRRIMVVKFPVQFTGEKCNPNLKKQLTTPECSQAVLARLVNECVAWQKELAEKGYSGLICSSEMQQETAQYFDDNDFISEFVATWCNFDAAAHCTVKKFTDKLKAESLKAQNTPPRKLANLIVDWAERTEGVNRQKSTQGEDRSKWCLFGLELREDPNSFDEE